MSELREAIEDIQRRTVFSHDKRLYLVEVKGELILSADAILDAVIAALPEPPQIPEELLDTIAKERLWAMKMTLDNIESILTAAKEGK